MPRFFDDQIKHFAWHNLTLILAMHLQLSMTWQIHMIFLTFGKVGFHHLAHVKIQKQLLWYSCHQVFHHYFELLIKGPPKVHHWH